MRNSRKQIKVFLFVLISILTISIGYASISAINMLINGNGTASVNQNNFKVHFIEAKEITGTTGVSGTTIIESNDTIASFNVTGLTKAGDYAEAKYTVSNDSNTVGAEISLNVTSSNSEYFKVTETILDNKLQAGDTTIATVKVEMIKTPITDSVTTSVTARITATPLENANATGGSPASKIDPTPFASDSWTTIKTNVQNGNTDQYNVGDTKAVSINGTNYTVRIANTTTGEHCGDNDTSYSQTACGFVVEFVDIVEQRAMNPGASNAGTNVGGWPGSKLYTYLQGTFYNSLPSDLKSAIKPTRVISGYGCIKHSWSGNYTIFTCTNPDNNGNNFSSTDNLYLLSGVEVFESDSADTAAGTTHQLEYYSNNSVSYESSSQTGTNLDKATKQYNGSNAWYWLRSVDFYTSEYFRSVYDYGRLGDRNPTLTTGGLAPAFRIG